jgi:ribosomal protein S3AE
MKYVLNSRQIYLICDAIQYSRSKYVNSSMNECIMNRLRENEIPDMILITISEALHDKLLENEQSIQNIQS